MGCYLACGIATEISVSKKRMTGGFATKEEIVNNLIGKLKPSVYNIEETENYVNFIIKKDVFEKNIISFIKEQLEKAAYSYMEEATENVKNLEGKNFDELMKIADQRSMVEFQLLGGDVSYLSDGEYRCDANIIHYISDGKISMECYYDIFRYLRETIVESSNNPLKDAAVITITD